MSDNNISQRNDSSDSFCIKLDESEKGKLNFIMHEIHGALISLDNAIAKIAKCDFSSVASQEIVSDEAKEAQRCSSDLRMMLDFWQLSNSEDYFDNAVARPQKLWNKFYYLNSYFKSVIRKKGLTFEVIPGPGRFNRPPISDFTGYPIINAIANILVDNAIKYSPNGDSIICEFDEDSDNLSIVIENNGPYVSTEEIQNIFLCGMRGSNANKTSANGHGYGMNFLKLIIDAHDGTIDISSRHDFTLNGIPYGKYTCSINLPKYAYDDSDEEF